MRFSRFFLLVLPLSVFAGLASAQPLTNQRYRVEPMANGAVRITSADAGDWIFKGDFTVLLAPQNPTPAMRPGNIPRVPYNVLTWQAPLGATGQGLSTKKRSVTQAGDGFDDRILEGDTRQRTADLFSAAPATSVRASAAARVGAAIVFSLPPTEAFELAAELTLPPGDADPILAFTLVPKTGGWFSVGYLGAPAFALSDVAEVWQPFIWQEKRFPTLSYLTPAFECPLPAAMIRRGDVALTVLADADEFPFQPLPVLDNSRFGVALRNAGGEAQPMVFAPMLGGPGSHRGPGQAFTFKLRLAVTRAADLTVAYEELARRLYGFRDFRQNSIASLNQTLDNMIDYGMSRYSWFVEELKGCAYSTDVPGAVKNVSSLNPLEMALIADDESIFQQRAYPIVEFMLSREKFLFSLDPKQKIQSPSRAMAGPCAPLSELATLYGVSHGASPVLLRLAEEQLGRKRTLNLDDETDGGSWPNQLAMFQATGNQRYLDAARRGADEYMVTRLDQPAADFNSPGLFFWPAFAPNWIDLFRLYEATGDSRYLEGARRGARQYTMFTWMSPRVPDEGVNVNPGGNAPIYWYLQGKGHQPMRSPEAQVPAWRLSEIGLTPESSGTMSGHRGIFMVNFAPWMTRIAAATKDSLLHDVARSAVVGRYRSFPGYHINTARTDIYERADYPLHEHKELSVNSFHYNHIWPHMSLLVDYLVSDTSARSGGAIEFPAHFIEGYAYLQSKFYGDRAGRFYGYNDAFLWMPRRLLSLGTVELNYLAARGEGRLYVAFTNQSNQAITTEVALNASVLPQVSGREFRVSVLQGAMTSAGKTMRDGRLTVAVAPRGLTAIAIEGLAVTPKFQQKLIAASASQAWKQDYLELPWGNARAMILNFGSAASTAYVYLRDDDSKFKEARITYKLGGETRTVSDATYPFEFTIPVPEGAAQFDFELQGTRLDGRSDKSGPVSLRR